MLHNKGMKTILNQYVYLKIDIQLHVRTTFIKIASYLSPYKIIFCFYVRDK